MEKTLDSLHRNYVKSKLNRSDLPSAPYELFTRWLKSAEQAKILDFNAMNIATVDATHRISSRIVLLKSHSEKGLVFYTDNRSKKAQQLSDHSTIAAHFYWAQLERQTRIEGRVDKIPQQQAAEYFLRRPKGSQISSIASHQSQIIPNRSTLQQHLMALEAHYQLHPIRVPDHWQGYVIKPDYWEFWQGGANRTHDRFQYQLNNNIWHIDRLSP